MTYKVVKELQNGFQIGRFRVYPAHNKIEIEERTASIEPKVMHVLCFLVENNGSVVSRDTLAESLWPNQVVSYDVITRAIFELRKVFSDSAKEPQFIETISRKGYCFICPVTLLEKRDELSVTKKSKIHHPKNLIAGIFLIALASTFLLYSFTQNGSEQQTPELMLDHNYSARLFTFEDTHSGMPALSFSQKKALWVNSPSTENPNYQLIIFDIASNKKDVLFSSENEIRFPHWGRGDKNVYFASCVELACEIIVLNVAHNEQKKIHKSEHYIASFDISPDNDQLVMTKKHQASMSLSLIDLKLNSATEVPLEEPIVASPIFDLNGESIFYTARHFGKASSLYKYDIAQNMSTLLTEEFFSILSIANKTKNKLWLSAKRDDKFHLWEFDVSDKKSVVAISELGNYIHSELSTSGTQSPLILKKWKANRHVEQLGLSSLTWIENVNKAGINLNATYSKGITDFVYFVSNRTGGFEVWKQSPSGSEQITQFNAISLGRPLVSFDQAKIAIISKKVDENLLYIVDAKSKAIAHKLVFSQRITPLNWSKDSDTLFFSRFEKGKYSLFAYHLEEQTQSLIAENAGLAAFDDPQSDGVFFIDLKNKTLAHKGGNEDVDTVVDLSKTGAVPQPGAIEIIDGRLYFIRNISGDYWVTSISLYSDDIRNELQLPDGAVVTQIGKRDNPFVIYDIKKPDVSQIVQINK